MRRDPISRLGDLITTVGRAVGWCLFVLLLTLVACAAIGPFGLCIPGFAAYEWWKSHDQGGVPPLTDEEARIAAGMDCAYHSPSFRHWRRIRSLRRSGLIWWDDRDGVIKAGTVGFSKKRWMAGEPQVTGWVDTNPAGDPGSQVYNEDYIEYLRHFAKQAPPPFAPFHGGP